MMNELIVSGKTMSSREISELTGKQHQHVKRDIEKMFDDLQEDPSSFGRIYLDSMNREQTEYTLDRELTETLLTGYSATLRRRVIRRWRELEAGASAPVASPVLGGKVVAELAIMECYTRMLRPAPSSQVAMLTGIAKQNGLDPTFLPAYAIDAPPSADGSSLPTKPLTALLADHRVQCTAASFNLLLREAGLLEQRERKTSTGATKSFWAITARGLEYGKNITSPAQPRETQPHWYAERFGEVLSLVNARVKGKAA